MDVDRPVGAALVRIAVLVTERYEVIGAELGVNAREGRMRIPSLRLVRHSYQFRRTS